MVSSRSALDTLILSSAESQWLKVAMVIARVSHEATDCSPEQQVGLAIQDLVARGDLDAFAR